MPSALLWLLFQLLWSLPYPEPPPERAPAPKPAAAAAQVAFARDVQPILERRCTPCHFPGGTMHAKLPFDRGETIDRLGTKLFSRIKDDKEQELIRKYLARR
ncbi:MAG TPA: hypothetical protein VHL59_16410 [Thermoanaerobaculia bacterium]|nr:hypothetical protein [Thermoanaerobaculia bacterium]